MTSFFLKKQLARKSLKVKSEWILWERNGVNTYHCLVYALKNTAALSFVRKFKSYLQRSGSVWLWNIWTINFQIQSVRIAGPTPALDSFSWGSAKTFDNTSFKQVWGEFWAEDLEFFWGWICWYFTLYQNDQRKINKNCGPPLSRRNTWSLGENWCASLAFLETQITDYQVWGVLHSCPEQMSHRHIIKERHQTIQTTI